MARRAGRREVFSAGKKNDQVWFQIHEQNDKKKPISVTMTNVPASTEAL